MSSKFEDVFATQTFLDGFPSSVQCFLKHCNQPCVVDALFPTSPSDFDNDASMRAQTERRLLMLCHSMVNGVAVHKQRVCVIAFTSPCWSCYKVQNVSLLFHCLTEYSDIYPLVTTCTSAACIALNARQREGQ